MSQSTCYLFSGLQSTPSLSKLALRCLIPSGPPNIKYLMILNIISNNAPQPNIGPVAILFQVSRAFIFETARYEKPRIISTLH
jgi:hypothetical protein